MVEYIGKKTRRMFIKPLTIVIRLVGVIFFLCFSSVFPKILLRNTRYLVLQGEKKVFLKV